MRQAFHKGWKEPELNLYLREAGGARRIRHRRLARPDRFLSAARKLKPEDYVPRPSLRDALVAELKAPSTPMLVVVGDAGAGKSSFVQGMARFLSENCWVPVPVGMRGERPGLGAMWIGENESEVLRPKRWPSVRPARGPAR
jgi:hypothetical protein